jgi:hypothetical protein
MGKRGEKKGPSKEMGGRRNKDRFYSILKSERILKNMKEDYIILEFDARLL